MNYEEVNEGDFIKVDFHFSKNHTEKREGIVSKKGIADVGPYAGRDVIHFGLYILSKFDERNIIKQIYTKQKNPEYFL